MISSVHDRIVEMRVHTPAGVDAAILGAGQVCTVGKDVVLTIRITALAIRIAVLVPPAAVDVAEVV
jgi:hypothetical protein